MNEQTVNLILSVPFSPPLPVSVPLFPVSGTDSNNGSFNLKALSGSSGYRFGVLAKIVNYMKVTTDGRTDGCNVFCEQLLVLILCA